jgi:hypothetical protein
MASPDLSYRQARFVYFYLGRAAGNGTAAARLAGYRHPEVASVRLLRNVKVRTAVEYRLDKAAMQADEVLARLTAFASVDADDFLRLDPDGKPPRLDLNRARRRGKLMLIRKIKQGKYGLEVELRDAQRALEVLARYHRLGDVAASASRPLAEILAEARAAADGYTPEEGPAT